MCATWVPQIIGAVPEIQHGESRVTTEGVYSPNVAMSVLRTCYFSKLTATRKFILTHFSLPCVLALPCTVAYSYCTMPMSIMPGPAFCPHSALLLICPLLICQSALPCPVLPCPVLSCPACKLSNFWPKRP